MARRDYTQATALPESFVQEAARTTALARAAWEAARSAADFAAFALNRTQLIIGKQKRTSIDNRLLEVLSPIAWNYQNIEKKIVPLADNGPLMTNEADNC